MDLKECRNRIDEIDNQIIKLVSDRMDVSSDVAAYKKDNKLPVYDPRRERQKLLDVLSKTPDDMKSYMSQLYSLLFDMSRSYQTKIIGEHSELAERISNAIENTDKVFPDFTSVACQGVEGANSQIACDKLFKNANVMFFSSFDAVFTAIEKGLCKYGVIPVENSTAGSVNSVYDLMMKHNFNIVRSIRVKIDHNLLVKPGTKLSDVKEIYSHEQAINQCGNFLKSLPNVKVIPCANTAVAAEMVSKSDRNDMAALSSKLCMKYYGLENIAESVQDQDNNYTRFICISKNLEIYPGANRTSLMAVLPHEPGSLYKLLSKLYALGINLIKLESRPIPQHEFEFMFYFDLDVPVYSEQFMQLIKELPNSCESYSYLGSYSEVV